MESLAKIAIDNAIGRKILRDDVKRISSERQSVVKMFLDKLNDERKNTKYKPLTGRAVAIKLSHLDLRDMYAFYKSCEVYERKTGSFSRAFFGALKVRDK